MSAPYRADCRTLSQQQERTDPTASAWSREVREGLPARAKTAVPKARLACLDQARAIAILFMMLVHFLPGIAARTNGPGWLWDVLLVLGRFATPAFVTVFGVTAGFVFVSRIKQGNRHEVDRRLLQRAGLLWLVVLVFRFPDFVELYVSGSRDLLLWLTTAYSVLSFYALAFLSLVVWLRLVVMRPLLVCTLCGLLLWAAHSVLAFKLWSYHPEYPIQEWLRLNLVSGDYAYLPLMGSALLVLPIGVALRQAVAEGRLANLFRRLGLLGLLAVAVGLSYGTLFSDLSYGGILTAELKAPARAWYYLLFGGAALSLIAGLGALEVRSATYRKLTYPLGLIGQCALPIYVGHVFILPALQITDWLTAPWKIEGVWRVIYAAAICLSICVASVVHRHGKQSARKPAKPAGHPTVLA